MILKITCVSGRTLQYVAGVISTLCLFTDGIHNSWPSGSLPKLYSNSTGVPTSHTDGSWIVSTMMIGGSIGPFLFAYGSKYFGRKSAILLTATLQLLSWIIIAFANNVAAFIVARFIAGLADGLGVASVPVYIAEISEPKMRGKLGSLSKILMFSGEFFAYCVTPYITIFYMGTLCALISLLNIFLCLLIPESPYYALTKSNKDKSENLLQMLRGKNYTSEELKKISDEIEERMALSSSWKELFTVKSNLKSLFVVFILYSSMEYSGILVIASFSEIIFDKARSALSSSVSTIIIGFLGLAGCVLSSLVVDKLGRKPILIISCLGSASALGAKSIYSYLLEFSDLNMTSMGWFPIVTLSFYMIFYGFALSPVPILMAGEVFATNIKAKGTCLGALYLGFCHFVITQFFQTLVENHGSFAPFAGFASACIVGAIFIIIFVPETKGKSLVEIQEMLRGKENIELK